MAAPQVPMMMLSAQAEKSLRRQNESILAVAQEMAKNEESRTAAIASFKGPEKFLRSLSSRHDAERIRDRERLSRLVSEAATLKALGLTGAYDGMNLAVAKEIAKSAGPRPLIVKEPAALEKRGGLTTGENNFLKEVYTKFEDPVLKERHAAKHFPNPKPAPKAPNISYYRDRAASARASQLDGERLSLLNAKKGLLQQLDAAVSQQAELMRRGDWRAPTAAPSARGGGGGGRSRAAQQSSRTDYSYGGASTSRSGGGGSDVVMATFRGKAPPHTYTRKELMNRPKNVPQLW